MFNSEYFKNVITNIQKEVDGYSKEVLFFDTIIHPLTIKFKINIPTLDFSKPKIDIEPETITVSDPAYDGGKKNVLIDVVDFRVPIKGNLESIKIVNKLLSANPIINKKVTQGVGELIFIHHEKERLAENSRKLEEVKQLAKYEIGKVEELLNTFSTEAEKFNLELPSKITDIVDIRRKAIKEKESLTDQLNPWK